MTKPRYAATYSPGPTKSIMDRHIKVKRVIRVVVSLVDDVGGPVYVNSKALDTCCLFLSSGINSLTLIFRSVSYYRLGLTLL